MRTGPNGLLSAHSGFVQASLSRQRTLLVRHSAGPLPAVETADRPSGSPRQLLPSSSDRNSGHVLVILLRGQAQPLPDFVIRNIVPDHISKQLAFLSGSCFLVLSSDLFLSFPIPLNKKVLNRLVPPFIRSLRSAVVKSQYIFPPYYNIASSDMQ